MFISSEFLQPNRDQWKSWVTLGVFVLALINVGLMRVIWTHAFGLQERTYKRLSLVHRTCGYTAFTAMLLIAIVTCIGIIGYGGYAARPTWHSYLGITVLAMMGIKIIAVRKGLPEGPAFRRWALITAALATVALAVLAGVEGTAGAAVLPLFPLAALVGFIAWKKFGPLPVVGSGMALSVGLLFASSGGWWLAHNASKGDLPDVSSVTSVEAPDLDLGKKVFATVGCANCHGEKGFGGVGPSLRSAAFAYRNTPQSIAQQVRSGGGIMPAFGPDRISDKELAGLVAFIRNWYNQ